MLSDVIVFIWEELNYFNGFACLDGRLYPMHLDSIIPVENIVYTSSIALLYVSIHNLSFVTFVFLHFLEAFK